MWPKLQGEEELLAAILAAILIPTDPCPLSRPLPADSSCVTRGERVDGDI